MQIGHVVSPPARPVESLAALPALSVRSGGRGEGGDWRDELIRKMRTSADSNFHLAMLLLPAVGVALLLACCSTARASQKVFGIGLAETGGASLAAALTMLGYNTVLHDDALVPFLHPDSPYNFTHRYDHVDAVVGDPSSHYFKEILQVYPDARIVLTVRAGEQWAMRFQDAIADIKAMYANTLPFRAKALIETIYGTTDDDRVLWLSRFYNHKSSVKRLVPEAQLLVLDVHQGQGWAELCPFLNRFDGPCARGADTPFPQVEDDSIMLLTDERKHMIDATEIYANKHRNVSQYAYVALIADASNLEKRDYLMSLLVAIESLHMAGTKQDIVVLVLGDISDRDARMLRNAGTRLVMVAAIGMPLDVNPEPYGQSIAAIYRAKVRVLQLIEYEKVIFFDCDVIFQENCDDLFKYDNEFMGRGGTIAPLNTGFFVVKPSLQAFNDLNDVAISRAFTSDNGWMDYGHIPDWHPGYENKMTNWSFYCASTDQGLYYYYFMCYRRTSATWLGHPQSWEGRIVHFAGEHKPYLIHDISAVPIRFQAASALWLTIYSKIQRMIDTGKPWNLIEETDMPRQSKSD